MDKMLTRLKMHGIHFLRWSERYTKTDMVYLATNGFWLNLSSASITLLSFLLYIAFARFLPKDVYGTYQYLLSLAAIIGTITLSGMGTAVSQAVARGFDGTYRTSLIVQFKWALIPLTGSLAAALYYYLNGNMTLAGGLLIIGLALPITTTFNTYSALLIGKKDFRRIFLYNLFQNLPYYGCVILAAYFFKIALVLLLVNFGIQAIVLFLIHLRTVRVYPTTGPSDPEALSYGTHLSIMGIFTAIAGQLDSVLVFHYLGAVDLAIYSFATAIPDRATNFFRVFSITALPKFSEKSDQEIRSSIGPKLLQLALVALVGAAIYIVLAPTFFRLVFPQYVEAVPFSALYALSMISAVGAVALSALTAQKLTKDLYAFNIGAPILQFGLQWIGITIWGLWGLVAMKTISTILTSAFAAGLYLRNRAPRSSTPSSA
jgi:O-antigen/teichoic acid export membrane protein